jgi:hypothetical protein
MAAPQPTRRSFLTIFLAPAGASTDGANDCCGLVCWHSEAERLAVGKLERLEELFAGRHFDSEIILLCVRWYLRFKLSLRDLVEMMAERGVALRIPPSCDGCSITHRSSKSAGRVMPLPSAGHGVSTRHTSRSRACGTIYIVPWTERVGRLTSD